MDRKHHTISQIRFIVFLESNIGKAAAAAVAVVACSTDSENKSLPYKLCVRSSDADIT